MLQIEIVARHSGTVLNEKAGGILHLSSPRPAPRTLYGRCLVPKDRKAGAQEFELPFMSNVLYLCEELQEWSYVRRTGSRSASVNIRLARSRNVNLHIGSASVPANIRYCSSLLEEWQRLRRTRLRIQVFKLLNHTTMIFKLC